MRLNHDGVVDRVVGSALQTHELQDIVMLEIDREGKLYAVDRRTATTHVSDADFNLLHVCKIAPDDFAGELFDPSLTISDESNVHAQFYKLADSEDRTRSSRGADQPGKGHHRLALSIALRVIMDAHVEAFGVYNYVTPLIQREVTQPV